MGEALNTPGAENAVLRGAAGRRGLRGAVDRDDRIGAGCGRRLPGRRRRWSTSRASWSATSRAGGFDGYYLQDAGDGDAATSDGIFVYAPGGLDVAVGDEVHVVGTVSEFFGMTEITVADAEVCANDVALPPATVITLPVASPDVYEPLEGMRVTLPQSLSILEFFEFGRFGTVDVGSERHMTPTAVAEPGAAANVGRRRERARHDHSRRRPQPGEPRPGDPPERRRSSRSRTRSVAATSSPTSTGVLDYRIRRPWAVQPTEGADYEAVNTRDANPVPEVGGTTKVASFNVLNYFTTLDEPGVPGDQRGANDAEEFERQESKIVSAIAKIDADIVGLIEIENSADDTPLKTLVEALNEKVGAPGTYDFISTGKCWAPTRSRQR